MNKNYIFIGVIGAALLVAAIANNFSSDDFYSDDDFQGSWESSHSGSTVEFNGKSYKCDSDTKSVVLEHEDGSTTTVICD